MGIGGQAVIINRLQPKPALYESYVDQDYGTTIRRITDVVKQFNRDVAMLTYNTVPILNRDESLGIIYTTSKEGSGKGAGHFLINGKTYEVIRPLGLNPSDIEHLFWHPTDPDVLFFPTNYGKGATNSFGTHPSINKVKISTAEVTELAWFSDLPNISFGHPKYMARDGSKLGLFSMNGNVTFWLDTVTGAMGPRIPAASPANGLQVAPTGKYAMAGPNVINLADGSVIRQLHSKFNEHLTMTLGADGRDKVISAQFDVAPYGSLIAEDLVDGTITEVISPNKGWGYPGMSTHPCGLNLDHPEWVGVSSVGFASTPLTYQMLMLGNISTGEVRRIANHHSKRDDMVGWPGYFAEPHFCWSPTGTRVFFDSDWCGGTSEAAQTVDLYVCELPNYKP
jgi:hypothetical protein